jgi:class 3 adenylate cyclase
MFYERATDAVIARDGTVDKLLGEEVIAFFGAPYNEQEHERRAVEAALEVIRVLASFWGDEPLARCSSGQRVASLGGSARERRATTPLSVRS